VSESGYEQILLDVDGAVATITLNRPERLNAYTDQMMRETIDALDRVESDDAVRAVIFTGAGRAYCAGADLGSGGDTFAAADERFEMGANADGGGILTLRLFRSTKPLIAAVNGPAVGVGVTSTLPMDFRLASTDARFGFVFARRGIVPEAASSWFLPRIVGALDWTLTGRVFDAAEALRCGLVASLHEPDELLPAARAIAQEIAEHTSPVAVALARAMMWRMLGEPGPRQAHEIDSRGIFYMGRSADAREGVTSMRVPEDLPEFFTRWREAPDTAAFLARERAAGAQPSGAQPPDA
jgi:enoyl-CoA hydratase/carnithine racemase